MRRFLIHAGLGIAVTLTSALVLVPPALLVAALLEWLVGTPFWWTGFGLLLAGVIATNIWWWRRQKASIRKTIRDFPNPEDVRTHQAEWKAENFDRLLSRHVRYARSANAIDETRKDFDRVAWGGVQKGVPQIIAGHKRLIQWWFTGNHSDIGGSYPETESRLSDVALEWMIEQSTVIPNGLKIGPVIVNGEKMTGTGDVGPPLHIFPSSDGLQHCEIAGMRDTLEQFAERLPGFLRRLVAGRNWEEQVRKINPKAEVHPTVVERYKLNNVPQCAGSGAYRPRALENHDKFKGYYSPTAAEQGRKLPVESSPASASQSASESTRDAKTTAQPTRNQSPESN
jgi:T6SS, Phospholipase effector Tle1-like, catalytic domain